MQITPGKELSLFDSTCIIIGIIIVAGIYEISPLVAANMPGWSSVQSLKMGVL
jgi:hypothetical protein